MRLYFVLVVAALAAIHANASEGSTARDLGKKQDKQKFKEEKKAAKEEWKGQKKAAKSSGEWEKQKAEWKKKQQAWKNKKDEWKERFGNQSDPESYNRYFNDKHHENGDGMDGGTQIYKKWRDGEGGGMDLLQLDDEIALSVTKDLRPYAQYYNKLADKDDCSMIEVKSTNERLAPIFNGLIESRGFNRVQWAQMIRTGDRHKYYDVGKGGGGRNLRANQEEDRELRCWCPECPGYWICHMICDSGYCRRRLGDEEVEVNTDPDPDNLTLDKDTFEKLEAVVTNLQKDLNRDCERLLRVIARTSFRMGKKCRKALADSFCEVGFNYSRLAKIVLKLNKDEKP